MGFRETWEQATAAAADPNSQYHDAGVQTLVDYNTIMANNDTNTYDLSNKGKPQSAENSIGYQRAQEVSNKLADYAKERGQTNTWNYPGNTGNFSASTNSSDINYGGNNEQGSGGGQVYGPSGRYGGVSERANEPGTPKFQSGTGLGTSDYLGDALSNINYNALADELFQMDRNDWYQPPQTQPQTSFGTTPLDFNSDAFRIQEDMKDAYSPYQTFNENYYKAQLDQMQGGTPRSQPIEYSDAFIRQQDMNDAYSPNQTFNDNYRAMLSRIQEGDTKQTTPPSRLNNDSIRAFKDYTLETRQGREPLSRQDRLENAYNTQFQKDLDDMKRQFPNYSYNALVDMVLVGEEMRNGQSSYYKWLASRI